MNQNAVAAGSSEWVAKYAGNLAARRGEDFARYLDKVSAQHGYVCAYRLHKAALALIEAAKAPSQPTAPAPEAAPAKPKRTRKAKAAKAPETLGWGHEVVIEPKPYTKEQLDQLSEIDHEALF